MFRWQDLLTTMFNILFSRIFAQFKKNTWRKTKDKQTEKDEKIKILRRENRGLARKSQQARLEKKES